MKTRISRSCSSGTRNRLKEELDGQDHDPKRIDIVHAAEVIEFDESPVEALRRKKDNSIVKAFKLKLKGEADAVVSAGNTGAVVGAGTLLWKLIPGVRRAGIAVTLGTQKYHTLLIDVGANIHCRPLHLLHYGMMASIYAGVRPRSRESQSRTLEHRLRGRQGQRAGQGNAPNSSSARASTTSVTPKATISFEIAPKSSSARDSSATSF